MSDAETKEEVMGAEAFFEGEAKEDSENEGDQMQKSKEAEEGAEKDTEKDETYASRHEKDQHEADEEHTFSFTNLRPEVDICMKDESQQAGTPAHAFQLSFFKKDGLVANVGDSLNITVAWSRHTTPVSILRVMC